MKYPKICRDDGGNLILKWVPWVCQSTVKPDVDHPVDVIDDREKIIMFRCTGRCRNQFSKDRLLTHVKTNKLHCPICKGEVRQLYESGDLYDTYV